MSKLKKFVSLNVLIKVYYCLVYSHIQYCISCWGWIAQSILSSISVYQKRCIRIICGVPSNTHTSPLFNKLGLLKMPDIYTTQIAKIMHRYSSNNWTGSYDIKSVTQVHSHFTRFSKVNFFPRQIQSKMSRGTLSTVGPKIWSTIPQSIKCLNFLPFKFKLKQHLIKQYEVVN